tara:strand:+ start:959 stop:1522 length:564 start_codon:yes stop_codon:yes gene_type:complete
MSDPAFYETQAYLNTRQKEVKGYIERSGHLKRTAKDDLTSMASKLLGGIIHYRFVIDAEQYWHGEGDLAPVFIPSQSWIKRCKELNRSPDVRTWDSEEYNRSIFRKFHELISIKGMAFLQCNETTRMNAIGGLGISVGQSLLFFISEMTKLRCQKIERSMTTEYDTVSEQITRNFEDYYPYQKDELK